MLIIGAGGHAKEILDILISIDSDTVVTFFDDVSNDLPALIYNKYKIIKSLDDAQKLFLKDPRFVLGLGIPIVRKKLADKFVAIGGILESVISPRAQIGCFNVVLGKGLNIMHGVLISSDVAIGEGSLINAHATIHHDTKIGKYCEVSPGAHITGGCKIGDFCIIGAGAIILPKIQIGKGVTVGAGAVVTKNIPDDVLAKGVPAKIYKKHV